MKLGHLFALPLPFLFGFTSCMAPNTGGQGGGGTYADPNNPYAVPGVSTQGGYAPAAQAPYQPAPTNSAPYQPIPSNNVNIPATTPSYTPTPPRSTTPASSGGSHTVASGDTLWGISRKYSVSVADIKQANSITGDTIVTGTTLTIPR